ncbi:MAG: polysaccharide deacetylase family protein [Thermomicrobiales bacterium]
MKRDWRNGFAALAVSAVLLASGCAAGSPAVVQPAVQTPAAVLAAPDAALPQPTVAVAAPESPAPTTVSDPPASLAFAQDVPTVTEAAAQSEEPATEPAPQPDVTTQTEALPADTAPADDSAPPPDVVTQTDAIPADTAPVDAAPEDAAAPAEVAAPVEPAASDGSRPAAPGEDGSGMSEIIEGGTNGRPEIALTFDAGADTGYAAEILDYLRDQGIHATFGMTGMWAEANPELVQRMVNEGHQLINHTWDHASLTGANTGLPPMTPEEVTQELSSTEDLVRSLTGYEMRPYFRPPYGDYDATSLGYLYDNGYYLSIWWTCDTHGWAGWGSQEIIDYCTTNIAEDEILLLHVGAAAAGDFEALPGLIQFFRDNGYTFVTVEEMLQP